MGMFSGVHRPGLRAAFSIVLVMMIITMIGEAAVMGILHAFDMRGLWDIVLAPVLLALLCCPVIFLLVLRPLARELQKARQSELERKNSRAFLQAVIDAIPSGTLVLGRDYRILLANRTARDLFGRDDPVADGLTCHELSHHNSVPCDGQDDPCPLREVVATRRPVTVTHVHTDAGGNRAFVEVTASPILDANGEVTRIVESCSDITERKEADEHMRATLEKVERFNRLAVGREMRMIELKEEVNALARKAQLPPPYDLSFTDGRVEEASHA